MQRRGFILSCVGVLTGCATGQVGREVADTPHCCANLADAKFVDYKPGTIAVARIDEASPTFRFSTGASRFAGFRLVQGKEPSAVLETVTEYDGFWLPSATIFVPRFAFLDASFKELIATEPELYQSTGKLHESGIVRRAFYGACFVPSATIYIAIHTDVSALASRRVRLLNPDSMGASRALERAKEAYQRTDKREFASGRVQHVSTSNAFAVFQLSRKTTGEIHFAID